MSSIENLRRVFRSSLELSDDVDVSTLSYRSIEAWDSVAHMALVSEIEDRFDICD